MSKNIKKTKSQTVDFRTTEKEKALLKEKARSQNMTVSEFVLKKVLYNEQDFCAKQKIIPHLCQMETILNNLACSENGIEVSEIEQLRKEIFALWQF